MATPHRASITAILIVCLVSAQGAGTVFASEAEPSSTEASSQPLLNSSAPEAPLVQEGVMVRALASLKNGELANAPRGFSASGWRDTFAVGAVQPEFAGQVYRGRPIRTGGSSRNGSIAALMIGSVASIAGAAVLIYANRPECTVDRFAQGCGYGTKVIGGAVLTGGIAGLMVGALTWR